MVQIVNGDLPIHSINVNVMYGDKTGYVHAQENQQFYIEFEAYKSVRSSPPCNFIVDEGAEIWLSQDFRVVGTHEPAFVLNGHLAGVYNLTIDHDRKVIFGQESTNARYFDGQFVSSPQGKMIFSRVAMKARALLHHPAHLHLVASEVLMRYASSIEANNITVEAGDIHIEGEARLDTIGRGVSHSNSMGPGTVDGQGYGTGGGHGGFGGGYNEKASTGM